MTEGLFVKRKFMVASPLLASQICVVCVVNQIKPNTDDDMLGIAIS